MKFDFELSWEFNTKEEIQARSIHAMRNHVDYIKEVSPFYRDKLKDIDPNSINDLESISELPFTTIEDIKDNLNDFFATHRRNIVEKVFMSIQKQKDTLLPLSKNDVDRVTFDSGLLLSGCGITSDNRVLLIEPLDNGNFPSLSVYNGLNVVGAEVFRLGAINNLDPVRIINEINPDVFAGSFNQLKDFGDLLYKYGISPKELKTEKTVCISGSYSSNDDYRRERLEEIFNTEVFSYYLLSIAQTAFCECEKHTGLHSHPELLYTEILNQDGTRTPPGKRGELVVTPFGTEGCVFLRLRTGLHTQVNTEQCECRRNSLHLASLDNKPEVPEYKIEVNGTQINAGRLIQILESNNNMGDYSIIIDDGEGGASLISIHGIIRPGEIPVLSQNIMEEIGVPIPILVTNQATLKHIKGDSEEKIFDHRTCEKPNE